ncbi:LLM class flavin-dependent oxidoreductase [Haloferax sp. Atlit-4N]|uniref:LLM class oxidoreductase n=1 Tax=Haloferax sp. Atlit-4N TaxID=2077206 RepID=UPI000E27BB65|nr:LLM class oxidoreductase [Haloferax sp. Atlit-4N]RDZ51326.1 LLM class flavin-dependent oxidoreductase [Haloferax sp. Atlit-4N]
MTTYDFDHGYNAGYNRLFGDDNLTLGLFFPIESVQQGKPTMENQVKLAQRAESFGFDALWFRDVPLWDPSFGDAGHLYDTFTYLSYIAAHTDDIALATGSVVLPLRHPLHTAKQAASVDQLSDGRLVMGVASGDRPVEFPAFDVDAASRGELFREHIDVFRQALGSEFPTIDSARSTLEGTADVVPKPTNEIPLLVTGHARQERDWIAEHGDGWLFYTQDFETQQALVDDWRQRVAKQAGPDVEKPFAMSEHIFLAEESDAEPRRIHQGVELGRNELIDRLERWHDVGVDHLTINLRYNNRPAADVLEEIGTEVLPEVSFS